jgi:hypothetical protein
VPYLVGSAIRNLFVPVAMTYGRKGGANSKGQRAEQAMTRFGKAFKILKGKVLLQ